MNEENKNKKKPDMFIPSIILVLLASYLFNTYVFQLASVNGSSMYPTMKDGQILVISKIEKIENYKRGDIIIFNHDGRKFIKRLIAFPNETVQIKNNNLIIDGNEVEDYVDIEMEEVGVLKEGIKLNNDQFLFLGDNRNRSNDCRAFGPVNKKDIIGKVILRLYPLDTKF